MGRHQRLTVLGKIAQSPTPSGRIEEKSCPSSRTGKPAEPRDTRSTAEKRFIHYVYRAYKHFQQAVDAGEALWEGVRKPPTKTQSTQGRAKNSTEDELVLDPWGFSALNHKEFIRFNGTATLSDVRSAIVGPRKYGPRWDNALVEEIGHRKSEKLLPKIKEQRRTKKASIDVNPNQ
ncbi:MAG: hypothetical protein M1823_007141, partial [Watsoniomyces obsoletus]